MVALSSPQQTNQSVGLLSRLICEQDPDILELLHSPCLSWARCFLLCAQSLWYWPACFPCTGSLDTLCLQVFLSVVLAAECVSFIPCWTCSHSAKVKELQRPTQTHTDTHTYGREANYTVHHAQSPSSPLSPAIILLDISPFHLQMTDTIESGHSHSASGTFSSKNRDHNKSQCGQGQ